MLRTHYKPLHQIGVTKRLLSIRHASPHTYQNPLHGPQWDAPDNNIIKINKERKKACSLGNSCIRDMNQCLLDGRKRASGKSPNHSYRQSTGSTSSHVCSSWNIESKRGILLVSPLQGLFVLRVKPSGFVQLWLTLTLTTALK